MQLERPGRENGNEQASDRFGQPGSRSVFTEDDISSPALSRSQAAYPHDANATARQVAFIFLLGPFANLSVDIPAIVVEISPSTPPPSTTRDITSARGNSPGRMSDYSPSPVEHRLPDFTLGEPNRTSLQRSRRTSEMSTLTTDLSLGKYMLVFYLLHSSLLLIVCRRDSSPIDEDPQSVISSTQQSLWEGNVILPIVYLAC